MVAALSKGSRGKTLNSSYGNRDSTDYKVSQTNPQTSLFLIDTTAMYRMNLDIRSYLFIAPWVMLR